MGSRHNILKLFLPLCCVLMLSGCLYSSDKPQRMASGKQMYNDYCAGCHRATGIGKFFLGVPPSFSSGMKRAQIVRLIRQGHPDYSRMPVFPQISFSQAQKIVDYLYRLEEQQPQ